MENRLIGILCIRLFLVLFCSLFMMQAFATNYYWIGGGGNWADLNHWATTSGGNIKHTQIPSTGDNVYFDAGSGFTSSSKVVTLNVASDCASLKFENNAVPPTLQVNNILAVYGSFTLQAGMTVGGSNSIYFSSGNAGNTITTNGVLLNNTNGVYINGTGSWELMDDFKLPRGGGQNSYNLIFTSGTLTTNGHAVSCTNFCWGTDGTSSRILNMANSIVECDGWRYMGSGAPLTSANTAGSVVRVYLRNILCRPGDVYNVLEVVSNEYSSDNGNNSYAHHTINGGIFKRITFLAGKGVLGASSGTSPITTDTLEIKSSGEFQFYTTVTVNKLFRSKLDNCGGIIELIGKINSTDLDMQPGAISDIYDSRLQNMKATGGTFTANRSVDVSVNSVSTNSGFIFPAWTPSENTFYWVGGNGNWWDASHWSNTSGGAGGFCIPTPWDNVIFDAGSGFTATAKTVMINAKSYCNTMTWNGAPNNPILNVGPSPLEINGSLTLQRGMSLPTTQPAMIYFTTNLPGRTITTNGVAIRQSVCFNSLNEQGGWILQDSLRIRGADDVPLSDENGYGSVYFYSGSLNFNGQYVSVNDFNSPNNSYPYKQSRSLNIAGSTVFVRSKSSSWQYSGGQPLTAAQSANSLIKIESLFSGFTSKDGDYYNNVEFINNGSGNAIQRGFYNKVINYNATGSFQFVTVDSLLLLGKGSYTFLSGTATANHTKINKYFTLGNTCGGSTNLGSTTSGIKAYIDMGAGAAVDVSYASIKDIAVGPNNYIANSSEDAGNNSGWTFIEGEPHTYYWVGGTGNWSDINHWSASSGGVGGILGGACLPGSKDNVIFDNHSFNSPGDSVRVDGGIKAQCDSMSWIGDVSWKPVLDLTKAHLYVNGSLEFQRGMTMPSTSTYFIYIQSSRKNESLKTNSTIIACQWSFNGSGGWNLQDSLVFLANSLWFDFQFVNGDLNFNRQYAKLPRFNSQGGNSTRTLNIANSTILLAGNGNWTYTGGAPLTTDKTANSTILSRNGYHPSFQTKAGDVYNNVSIDNTGSLSGISNGIYNRLEILDNMPSIGSITADTLIFASAGNKSYSFISGATSYINEAWFGSGSPCALNTIKSTIQDTRANISVDKAAANIDPDTLGMDFIYVRDINIAMGADRAIVQKGTQSPNEGGWGSNGNNFGGWDMMPYLGSSGFIGLGPSVTLCPQDYPYTLKATYFYASPSSSYEWRLNNATGAILGADPTLTVNGLGTYYLKVTYAPNCNLSSTKALVQSNDSLIWNGSVNADWNNYRNWTNPFKVGQSESNVPRSCTSVLIPGGLSVYPDLEASPNGTSYVVYPDAVCYAIHYGFGGEVAKPNYLTYVKAYVQYNFGYYSGSTYKTDGDPNSALPMKRGQWYALAAPLKQIVSGDFSFGGQPDVWRQSFIRTTVNGDFSGMWQTPDNPNALEIGTDQAYGISVWAAKVESGSVGEDVQYQTNLNKLKGVIEMPYFQNTDYSNAHRIHEYVGGRSRFYYYFNNNPQQSIAYNIYDEVTRTGDAYRFIFDGNMEPVFIGTDVIPAFKITVPAGKEVMIGNPFISNLDFNKFYEFNSDKIQAGYRLYVDNTWEDYSYISGSGDLNRFIAPLQAFFVQTIKGGTNDVDLYFLPDSVSVTKPVNHLKTSVPGFDYDNALYVNVSNSYGNSWMTIGLDEDNKLTSIPRLFNLDPLYVNIPQIFASFDGETKNSVQYVDPKNKSTVPLDVRSQAKGKYRLQFENQENMHVESLILYDKELEIFQDLNRSNIYSFENISGNLKGRFHLMFKQSAITEIEHTGIPEISIYAIKHSLYVDADQTVNTIQISNTQGLKVFSALNIDSRSFRGELTLPDGVYIVSVILENGEMQNKKIIVK